MSDHSANSREQGFTLIEVLMAITISGIILGTLVTGFIVIALLHARPERTVADEGESAVHPAVTDAGET